MLCVGCNVQRKEKEYFGKETCYKCQYTEKMKNKSRRANHCKICKELLPKKKWAYCDYECAAKGKEMHRKNYFTNYFPKRHPKLPNW